MILREVHTFLNLYQIRLI